MPFLQLLILISYSARKKKKYEGKKNMLSVCVYCHIGQMFSTNSEAPAPCETLGGEKKRKMRKSDF